MNTRYFGELIAVLTALCWSIGIFPFTEASRRMNPNSVNHFRLLLGTAMMLLYLLIIEQLKPMDLINIPTSNQWKWFGLSGIIGLALGDYFGFTAYAILGTRVGSIYSTLAPGAALVLGYFVLNEHINVIGFLGMLITIAGIIWITLHKKDRQPKSEQTFGSKKKGILFAILAAFCQGSGLVVAKLGMSDPLAVSDFSSIHATFIRLLIATVLTYSISIFNGRLKELNKPILENQNNGLKYILAGTIFGPTLGVAFSMLAVSQINVSVAQTIFSLVPVIVLPLGYLFYREKISLASLFGATVTIAGVMVLIWRIQIEKILF